MVDVKDSISNPTPPILPYSVERSPQIDPQRDGGVVITVPTNRSLPLFLATFAASDLFAFVFIPLAVGLFWLFSTRKPRALLELTATRFFVAETDDNGLGIRVRRRWWRFAELGELRPNRFVPGLYVTIRGKDCFDLLGDLPAPVLAVVAAALADARARIEKSQADPVKESK